MCLDRGKAGELAWGVNVEGSGHSQSGALPFPTPPVYNFPALLPLPDRFAPRSLTEKVREAAFVIKNLNGNGRGEKTETREKCRW